MTDNQATAIYRAARDGLLALRDDQGAAVDQFSWPEFPGTFNWAVDWFDVIAQGNDRPALHIVEETGASQVVSFEQMRHRSDQAAHWLADHGVDAGHRVMLMLGNQVEMWEAMLAVMNSEL